MSDPVRRRREFAGDGRINGCVVALVVVDAVGPQQQRQEFAEGDVLDLSAADLAGQFIDLIAAQPGILSGDDAREAVVFPDEQRVHRRQADLLVDSHIACNEERRAMRAAFIVEALLVVRQESAVA